MDRVNLQSEITLLGLVMTKPSNGLVGDDTVRSTQFNWRTASMISICGRTLALVCLAAAGVQAARADDISALPAGRIKIEQDQDVGQVLREAALNARLETLRGGWLASGHSRAEATAGAPLALTSGAVLSTTLRVGDPYAFPALMFGYTSGDAGLSGVNFTFTSPIGPKTIPASYNQTAYSRAGTASFAYPAAIPYYAAPGTWTLTSATLFDNAGDSKTYDAKQLAALFSSTTLTVVNQGVVDAAAPVLGLGRISDTTISLSSAFPQLRATLKASDNLSGIALALLFIQPPGASYYFAQIATIPLPVKSGTIPIYDTFYPSDPVGTWNIPEYTVCDIALNCDTSKDPSKIFKLFGVNSITVKK